MKVAYFDCQFGAAGDMLVAALLDAGCNEKDWLAEVNKIALPPGSFAVKLRKVIRGTLAACKVDVTDESGVGLDYIAQQRHEPLPGQEGEPAESPAGGHQHHGGVNPHHHKFPARKETSPPEGVPSLDRHRIEAPAPYSGSRHLSDCLEIIEKSAISLQGKQLAERIFRRLARAEGQVHGVDPEQVHFHEVGAVDAIVDIVGFAIAYDLLGIEKSFVSAVPLGNGLVETAHGLLPVPGPAVVNLLTEAGAPTVALPVDYECLTPTGAAILSEIACLWGRQPAFARISQTGAGAGTRESHRWPNVCRVMIGELALDSPDPHVSRRFQTETVAQVEANLDDFSPQALSFVSERLFEAGALDVAVLPAVMKKGRSGHVLSVLCNICDRVKIQELILRETSSIGCRWFVCERLVASREWQEVELSFKERVRIKVARDLEGAVMNAQPEYDDCAAYASRHKVPIKDVIVEAMTKFLKLSERRI